MAGKKLEDAVPDKMYVTPKVREKEILQRKDNFTSTNMDTAARRSDVEELDSEWKRNLSSVRGKLDKMFEQKYAKGGAVPDFAKGGNSLPRTKYKWGK